MVNEQNPLAQYFRGTSTYVQLPSCGFYSNPEDIVKSPDGLIEVFAMTTADELLFKSPDALLNGESIAKVISSCVPGIKNVHDLPMNDIEALLLAIRQLTYGNQIDFSATCPNCQTEKDFGIDINWLFENIKLLNNDEKVTVDNGLTIKVKPYVYASSVKGALLSFNEGKFLQMLIEEDLSDEDKSLKATESYNKAISLTMELLSSSIRSMHTIVDGVETLISDNPEHIDEWLHKASRKDTKLVENKIIELNYIGIPKTIKLECESCKNEWETAINFDPSHFFA